MGADSSIQWRGGAADSLQRVQGVGDSQGRIHDFAGPYFVGVDNMAFGRPTRYLVLDTKRIADTRSSTGAEAWDDSVDVADAVYGKRMHNLWCVTRQQSVRRSACSPLRVAFGDCTAAGDGRRGN